MITKSYTGGLTIFYTRGARYILQHPRMRSLVNTASSEMNFIWPCASCSIHITYTACVHGIVMLFRASDVLKANIPFTWPCVPMHPRCSCSTVLLHLIWLYHLYVVWDKRISPGLPALQWPWCRTASLHQYLHKRNCLSEICSYTFEPKGQACFALWWIAVQICWVGGSVKNEGSR